MVRFSPSDGRSGVQHKVNIAARWTLVRDWEGLQQAQPYRVRIVKETFAMRSVTSDNAGYVRHEALQVRMDRASGAPVRQQLHLIFSPA